ncbi:MAG: M3 family oligoendopeptidase [Acholeplasmataceae bacterium]|jgi:M3 family oligoendopeptidase
MKFKDYKYVRPNLDELRKALNEQIAKLTDDHTFEEQYQAYLEIDRISEDFGTMATLASIRNSINTKDEFYEKETEFFDVEVPTLMPLFHQISLLLYNSKHRKQFEEKIGTLIFDQTELQLKTFKPEIVPLLQELNKLSTEYSKLIASAAIEFDGKTLNLSQMTPYIKHIDRETRKQAQLAVSGWLESKESEIDKIYDEMVQKRHQMALELGYENYVQLGYDKMGRTDYGPKEVAKYREQIYQEIVPIATELKKRRAKRLGYEDPKSYDLAISFLSGNATPKGDREWMVKRAKKMYEEMSKETGEFFNFMLDRELLDLDSKPGKRSGGYCTYIPNYKSPFIFANFNGTAGDVDVLTHEAGHAFQVYQSRDLLSSYRWPTMEAAEIHSMSMEFFAWPWIDLFFLEDTEKYKFDHLAGTISFLPYGVTVDEFQHWVYENPSATPDERKAAWARIEKKYNPTLDYGVDEFMKKGTYWFRQGHIFGAPFYYIDYTLAQVVAFQYWVKDQQDHKSAWDNYVSLCKLGGSYSFLGLLKQVGLENPFVDGTIKRVAKPLKAYLDSIDDTKL